MLHFERAKLYYVDCRDIYRIRKQTVWSSRLTTLTLVIKRSAQYQ
jgi:hypothetical protein